MTSVAPRWALRRGEESGAELRARHLRGAVLRGRARRGADGARLLTARRAALQGRARSGAGGAHGEQTADGIVRYYEGEKGAERVVRKERPDGTAYYEGGRGAEQLVRAEFADGEVHGALRGRERRSGWCAWSFLRQRAALRGRAKPVARWGADGARRRRLGSKERDRPIETRKKSLD